eukprot:19398_1
MLHHFHLHIIHQLCHQLHPNSKVPTISPSFSPSNEPSFSPSPAPSFSPSYNPSIVPSIAPSKVPTISPSFSPSNTPSFSPSSSPSFSPSNIPSNQPTISPSFSPSIPPTDTPTDEPTAAPTRVPTIDSDELYEATMKIKYGLKFLTTENKEKIMDYTSQVKTVVEEIIERGYFDEETLQFKDFWVDLIQINDVNVYYNSLQTSININAAINDDINTINGYDLDIDNYEPNKPVILSTDIKTSKLYSSAIQIKTYTDSFSVNVEKALQIYFNNNTKLQFNVETSENEIEIILPSTIQKESYTTIVIISGLIVGFGVLCSAVVLYLNE